LNIYKPGKYLNNDLIYNNNYQFKIIYKKYNFLLESELVSGFMTEHSAVIFVFFFLAEYASIVLICLLTSVLFLGGYLNFLPLFFINIILQLMDYIFIIDYNNLFSDFLVNAYSSLNLALKTSLLIFIFIWVRASFPRIRFDQLMSTCWTILLPIVIAYIILIPCLVLGLNILSCNISL
jgi:NADH-ubiquinone oxidoreductase chain 1